MKDEAEPPRSEVAAISLRLRHAEARNLGEMLRQWGHEPGHAWQAGEPCRAPNGRPLPGTNRDSYAYARLTLPPSGSLSATLRHILATLGPIQTELAAFVHEGGRAELFTAWHFNANSGDTLDWTLMQRLAEYRLNLALDIYPAQEGTVE